MLDWDDENIKHIARHGVASAEIDSMIEQGEFEARPHPKKRRGGKYSRRYLLRGTTLGGRRLWVVVDHVAGSLVRPVTAFDDK